MHLLWVRNAQSPVRQIDLTPGRLFVLGLLMVVALALLNVMAGWLLEAVGWEGSSSATTKMSESQYERKLIELESQIAELNGRLRGLDATRQQIIQDQPGVIPMGSGTVPQLQTMPLPISEPTNTAPPANGVVSNGGQGGPMMSTSTPLSAISSFTARIHQLERATLDIQSRSLEVGQRLQNMNEWKAAMPSGYPLPYAAEITSPPGFRVDPFTGQSSWHAGTDYAAYAGTPILATGDGYVIRAEWDNDFGNVVEISHPGVGMVTRYAHADQIYVRPGQRVSRGEAIASVGSSGRSTNPHLHYEVR